MGKVHEMPPSGWVPVDFAQGRLSPAFSGFGMTSGFQDSLAAPGRQS
jgi:hypothetical protein